MKKVIALLMTAVMAVAVLSACGDGKTTATSAAETKAAETKAVEETTAAKTTAAETETSAELLEPVKIGHIVDLTGAESMTGEEYERAVDFAIEQLGGVIGGHPVEIVLGDAQNNTATAADLATKMIEEDNVIAILGPTQIGQKLAVAEICKEYEIPLIFYNPTPPGLLASNEWMIGANGGSPQMPTVMADYAYNVLGYRTVNTISMDNAGGQSFINPFVEKFTALGGTVLTQCWHPQPCDDMASYLASMEKADAIVAWTSGSDAIALWTAWVDLGLNEKMPIISTMHGGFTDYFIAESLEKSRPDVAEAMLGTVTAMMYSKDSDTEENKELVEAWTAKYGEAPRFVAAGSCSQAIYLLDEALSSIDGETDPVKLKEAILAADFTGPEGHEVFDGSQAATKDIYVVKVVKNADGKYDHELLKVYEDVPPTGLQ